MSHINTLVVTRTRNRPALLQRAAETLAQQTLPFAWVIVNDGGAREPVDAIVRALPEALRCDLIHLDQSVGMEAAANIGMRSSMADGVEFAALHDDDDRWDPAFLETMTAALQVDSDHVGAVCHWREILETVSGTTINMKGESTCHTSGPLTLSRLVVRNRFPPIAMLFRKSAWEDAGLFNETLPVLGDWDFNLRLLLLGDLAIVNKVLAYQHLREGGASEFANSVTGSRDLHKTMRTRLINHYLREDIKAGKFGLGTLLAQADIVEDGFERTSLKSRLQRFLGRSRSGGV